MPKACPYDLGVIWVEKSPDLIHFYPIFTCFLVMIGFWWIKSVDFLLLEHSEYSEHSEISNI